MPATVIPKSHADLFEKKAFAHLATLLGDGDLRAWLLDLLTVTHRLNAHNGRIYWELAALEPEDLPLSPELAEAATERRQARRHFASGVTARIWHARGGSGEAPAWL